MEKAESIPIYNNVSGELFKDTVQVNRFPALLRGLDIGPCVDLWSSDYLAGKIGPRPVKIHVSEKESMNFIAKNFQYKTLPFDSLVQRAAQSEHEEYLVSKSEVYYLRSLGNDLRGREVSDIEELFPELSEDLNIPDLLEKDTIFSSVLRVASKGVQLWTHYDVMDNILIQITGRKRAVLYSPDDLRFLYMEGDKSQVIDIDHPDLEKYPEFQKAKPYECVMERGDILFIPALWFHNMTALDFSVAVNVFWRNLPRELYDKKDPYGNKDPLPASKVTHIQQDCFACA